MKGGSIVPGHLDEGLNGVIAYQHEHPIGISAEDDRLWPTDPVKDPWGHLYERPWWATERGDHQATVPSIGDTEITNNRRQQLLIGGGAAPRRQVGAADLTDPFGKPGG